MTKATVAALVAAISMCTVAQGAEADRELAELRAQLRAVMERLEQVEAQNAALAKQQSETRPVESAKSKGADWTSRVTLQGDLRYRYEAISDETLNSAGVQSTADRYRDRIRARLNAEVKATDTLKLGIGLATTEGGDPRSSNQTLTGVFSRKSLDLDLAYFDWAFASWGNLLGGKMKQPFFKPGQSLFWDGDINPEGLAVTFARGKLFGSAYGYWLNEVSGPETAVTADTMLYGAQLGLRAPLGDSTLTLAAHYYDLSGGQGRAPFYNNNANGNSTVAMPGGGGTLTVLANDYRVLDLGAELRTRIGELPLTLWADFAQNLDVDELDSAWAAGAVLGKAGDRRTWELGLFYQAIEKDALFAQLIDSDFAGGVSDGQGFVVRAGYAPVKNWVLSATYFTTERNVDVANAVGQTQVDYDRLQLDFNVKF